MSKLAEAIRRSQRVEAAPMGFGAARPSPKPTMLVGFRGEAEGLAAAVEAGADVLLVETSDRDLEPARIAEMRTAGGNLPLGVLPKSVPAGKTKELREKGLDFLVFEADSTPAAALLDEDTGYVLQLPNNAEELFLRSLESLSLEAIYLGSIRTPLTVSQQLELARVGLLTHKPLVCQVQPDTTSEDLQCLRAAGVVALLVEGTAAAVTRLKETIAALPPLRQRREERPVVSLPRSQARHEEDDDDDDD